MLCQGCGQRQATVQVSRIVQGQKRSDYLCDLCASAASQEADPRWGKFFDPLLPGPSLFGYSPPFRGKPAGLICPSCGETERELKESGLLGCEQCYQTFASLLDPVFRRVQGHTRHLEAPAKEDSREGLGELRLRLDRAIRDEAYEEAARIRDQIRNSQQDGEGDD